MRSVNDLQAEVVIVVKCSWVSVFLRDVVSRLRAEKLRSAVALDNGTVRFNFSKMCSLLNIVTSFPFLAMSMIVELYGLGGNGHPGLDISWLGNNWLSNNWLGNN